MTTHGGLESSRFLVAMRYVFEVQEAFVFQYLTIAVVAEIKFVIVSTTVNYDATCINQEWTFDLSQKWSLDSTARIVVTTLQIAR